LSGLFRHAKRSKKGKVRSKRVNLHGLQWKGKTRGGGGGGGEKGVKQRPTEFSTGKPVHRGAGSVQLTRNESKKEKKGEVKREI